MKLDLINPRLSAVTSFLLALPFATLVMEFLLGAEPSLGPLDPLLTADGSHLGSIFVIGISILMLAAFLISILPVVRNIQAGNGFLAAPVNLALAIWILIFILAFSSAILIDQYPCWIGVANCN